MGTFILIAIVAIIIFVMIRNRIKKIRFGTIIMITGGVKSGKSAFSAYTAIKKYKQAKLKYKVRTFFQKILHKELDEEPLLYSNVPLAEIPYVPLKQEHILRQERFNYKSVVYIQEASLVADSMSYKNGVEFNDNLMLFNKLFGHETKGGTLIYDTQTLSDNHYAVKRAIASYVRIQSAVWWLPFFGVLRVREVIHDEENDMVNTFKDDVEENSETKLVFIRKSIFKKYDPYCYSILTDHLPHPFKKIYIRKKKKNNLKQDHIVAFREIKSIKGEKKNEPNKTNKSNK